MGERIERRIIAVLDRDPGKIGRLGPVAIKIVLRDRCIIIHQQRVGAHLAGFGFANILNICRAAQGIERAAAVGMVHLLCTDHERDLHRAARDRFAGKTERRTARGTGIFNVEQRHLA